jgi:hypothetical protein
LIDTHFSLKNTTETQRQRGTLKNDPRSHETTLMHAIDE